MKLAILDIDCHPLQQIDKIHSEINECSDEINLTEISFTNKDKDSGNKHLKLAQLEALDLLTATFNLVEILEIPQEIQTEHYKKMLSYQTDPTRMYKIIKWVEIGG